MHDRPLFTRCDTPGNVHCENNNLYNKYTDCYHDNYYLDITTRLWVNNDSFYTCNQCLESPTNVPHCIVYGGGCNSNSPGYPDNRYQKCTICENNYVLQYGYCNVCDQHGNIIPITGGSISCSDTNTGVTMTGNPCQTGYGHIMIHKLFTVIKMVMMLYNL